MNVGDTVLITNPDVMGHGTRGTIVEKMLTDEGYCFLVSTEHHIGWYTYKSLTKDNAQV